jgi:hypothetical protein
MFAVLIWMKSWCGCLRPLGRNVGHRAFNDLQQRLLYAFAGNVT